MLRGSEAQKQDIKQLSVMKLQLHLLLVGVAANTKKRLKSEADLRIGSAEMNANWTRLLFINVNNQPTYLFAQARGAHRPC